MRDIMGMMGKVKEMQSKMEKVQAEIAAMDIEGQAGGGMVTRPSRRQGRDDLDQDRSVHVQGRRRRNP